MSTIFTNPASTVVQPLFHAIQSALSSNQSGKSLNGVSSASPLTPDSSRLSPLVQLLSTLQQLQQSDATRYSQVILQISANLQTATQTAQSEGNTAAATQFNQLSTDFNTASRTGQIPSIQDLASAVGGHRHHHGHHVKAAGSNAASSTAASPQTPDPVQIALDTLSGSANYDAAQQRHRPCPHRRRLSGRNSNRKCSLNCATARSNGSTDPLDREIITPPSITART
jgi:hypothetical protein